MGVLSFGVRHHTTWAALCQELPHGYHLGQPEAPELHTFPTVSFWGLLWLWALPRVYIRYEYILGLGAPFWAFPRAWLAVDEGGPLSMAFPALFSPHLEADIGCTCPWWFVGSLRGLFGLCCTARW